MARRTRPCLFVWGAQRTRSAAHKTRVPIAIFGLSLGAEIIIFVFNGGSSWIFVHFDFMQMDFSVQTAGFELEDE